MDFNLGPSVPGSVCSFKSRCKMHSEGVLNELSLVKLAAYFLYVYVPRLFRFVLFFFVCLKKQLVYSATYCSGVLSASYRKLHLKKKKSFGK